jgi:hypothetical protein
MTTRSGSTRPDLDTGQWKRIRAAVRRRDGNACVVCGRTDRFSVHHVVPARLGGQDSMDNLVTVCVLHHRQADAQLRRSASANLSPERFDDDPERGIYWGPPSEPGGKPRRWSRPWFDWRSEELEQRNCQARRLASVRECHPQPVPDVTAGAIVLIDTQRDTAVPGRRSAIELREEEKLAAPNRVGCSRRSHHGSRSHRSRRCCQGHDETPGLVAHRRAGY